MNVGCFAIRLGGSTPDHRKAVAVVLLAERLDVLHQLLDLFPLGQSGAAHIVGSFEPGDPVRGEHCGHRGDGSHLVADAFDVLGSENAGTHRRRICVIGIRVPASEHDVIEIGERHELPDQRVAVVGSLAEADVTHLRQRTDRGRLAGPGSEDSGIQGGGDGPHTGGENSQAAACRLDRGLSHESSRCCSSWMDGTGHPLSAIRCPQSASAHPRACTPQK